MDYLVENRKLNILLVEDTPSDTELIKLELEKHYPGCSIKNTVDLNEFTRLIDQWPPDVILTDYNMNGYTGNDILREAKTILRDPIIIIVSAMVGDEKAAQLIKQGITDYVLKNNLQKLPAVINRALKEREEQSKRREGDSLRELIIDNIDEIIYITDVDVNTGHSRVSFISPHVKRISGYSPEDFIENEKLWQDIIHPEDREESLRITKELIRENKRKVRFYRIKAKNTQRYVWLEDRVTPLPSENKNQARLFGSARDITHHKTTESRMATMIDMLSNKNFKLRKYAYMVSHKMRASMARIFGIKNLIEEANEKDYKQYLPMLTSEIQKLDLVSREMNDLLREEEEKHS